MRWIAFADCQEIVDLALAVVLGREVLGGDRSHPLAHEHRVRSSLWPSVTADELEEASNRTGLRKALKSIFLNYFALFGLVELRTLNFSGQSWIWRIISCYEVKTVLESWSGLDLFRVTFARCGPNDFWSACSCPANLAHAYKISMRQIAERGSRDL